MDFRADLVTTSTILSFGFHYVVAYLQIED